MVISHTEFLKLPALFEGISDGSSLFSSASIGFIRGGFQRLRIPASLIEPLSPSLIVFSVRVGFVPAEIAAKRPLRIVKQRIHVQKARLSPVGYPGDLPVQPVDIGVIVWVVTVRAGSGYMEVGAQIQLGLRLQVLYAFRRLLIFF